MWPLLLAATALANPPLPLPALQNTVPSPDAPGFRLRAVTLSLGATAGWQEACGGFGGRCRDWVAVSPFFDLSLELGGSTARLWTGFQSAPTYSYLLGYSTLGMELGELELGVMFGGDHFRAGIGAFGGFIAAGAIARAEILPWTGKYGRLHGFDVRTQVLVTMSAPAWQCVAAYTWTPWRRFGGAS